MVTTRSAADLREIGERLERAYQRSREQLQAEIERSPWYVGDGHDGVQPEDLRDKDGRFILLDALIALANVRIAINETEA